VCITDIQAQVDESVSVPSLHFPVVFAEDSKLVRTPGPAHPYMVVPSEVRQPGSESTPPDSSRAAFVFPSIAIYCHPPSPTVSTPMSTPPYSRSPSPMQCSPQCQSPTESLRPTVSNVEAEVSLVPVKQAVCGQQSVPTDDPRRLRAAGGSLSRSLSHPLHRNRGRSHPTISDIDELSSRCDQQTKRLKNL